MEPLTVVGTGLAILGSKDILNKVLGPTADYVGGEVKGLVEKCNVNLDGILVKAAKKLGEKVNEPGSVSPRVLKHLIDEGRFCEDELSAEYYGGLLASARSENGRDDRAVTYLSVLKELSTYQIRTHYLIYTIIRRLFLGTTLDIGLAEDREKMGVYIPASVYENAMDFVENEASGAILTHCIVGLTRLDLIQDRWNIGSLEHIKRFFPNAKEQGFIVRPTLHGAALYGWANAIHGATGHELTLASDLAELPEVEIIDGAKKLKN